MADPQYPTKFPENAYRELKPGEKYVPMVPPDMAVPEMTTRTFVFGLIMNIVFSVAATFLALKAGQGIETAIPISILAVGLSGFLLKAGMRASSILENVYVLSLSTTSGYVAGGTCFTMPAIYLLDLNKNLDMSNLSLFLQIALVPFLGAILGIIFLIPFRRYFVKDMHGKLPFPEATATNEILVTGASGSTHQAWILIYSFFLSAIYTFAATGLRLFSDTFTTGMAKIEPIGRMGAETLAFRTDLFDTLTNKVKAVFSMGAGAYYLGLGFIIGLRYASIICAGSFLSCFAIIPLLAQLDLDDLQKLNSSCAALHGPVEETPRFTLPLGFAAKLDEFGQDALTRELPERLEGFRAELSSVFQANDVTIPDEARISTSKLGEAWRISGELQSFKLKTADAGIEVRVGKRKDKDEPNFTIAAAFASKLDEFDPRPEIRTELGQAFATNSHEFVKTNVKIVVEEAGLNWHIQDKRQAYVLRANGGAGQISVYAREASASDIFGEIPKNIGIGAIFTAGLLSILKMSGVIFTALKQGLGSLFRKGETAASLERTDQDLGYGTMMVLGLLAVAVMIVFFRYGVLADMPNPAWLTTVSIILVLVIAFLFTTVSAWAIAMISVTPISGMTVTTIIITAVVLTLAGLPKGDGGMLATLLVGGVVCTALSLAGGLITNFKLAYWLGASPKKIAWNAILGSLVSAVFVCGTIMILAYKPGYTGGELPAPQANMMKSALESFLGTGQVPWLLYGVGVVIALTVELIGISALAFGLGMYLPMYINTPILAGAFVAYLVKKSAKKNEGLSKARSNKGILIASGLIAGGAIMEVLVNFTAAFDDLVLGVEKLVGGAEQTVGKIMPFFDMSGRMIDGGVNPESLARIENWLGLALFVALCLFVFWDCLRAKPSGDEPEIHM